MSALEIGKKLVELVKAGKNHEAMQQLYSPDIVSVEPGAPPGKSPEVKGLPACLEKGKQFYESMEIHGAVTEGPFPNGDRFAVYFDYDVTEKTKNHRFHLREVAVYTVKDDKIVREEFFYHMG